MLCMIHFVFAVIRVFSTAVMIVFLTFLAFSNADTVVARMNREFRCCCSMVPRFSSGDIGFYNDSGIIECTYCCFYDDAGFLKCRYRCFVNVSVIQIPLFCNDSVFSCADTVAFMMIPVVFP